MLSILLELLPWAAKAVGAGKASDLITTGTRVAKEVLGTDDVAAMAEKLADPAVTSAFVSRMEAETARLRVELEDVQDARQQTIQLVQAGSALAWAPAVLSTIIVAAFVGITGALLFKQVPDSAVAQMLFGQLAGMTGAVVQYWLGSSQGSRAKDAILASVASPVARVAQAVKRAVK